ncbi:unnamed protein product, partial [Rotaria socialis]
MRYIVFKSISDYILTLRSGPTWGEQDYIRIEHGTNTCDIAEYVSQVEFKKNN